MVCSSSWPQTQNPSASASFPASFWAYMCVALYLHLKVYDRNCGMCTRQGKLGKEMVLPKKVDSMHFCCLNFFFFFNQGGGSRKGTLGEWWSISGQQQWGTLITLCLKVTRSSIEVYIGQLSRVAESMGSGGWGKGDAVLSKRTRRIEPGNKHFLVPPSLSPASASPRMNLTRGQKAKARISMVL